MKGEKIKIFDLGIWRRLLPKDVHGFLNFQLEAWGSRVQNFKTIFWTKGATIFRTSQVQKFGNVCQRRDDASGNVSVGFTSITGTTACTWKRISNLQSSTRRDMILDPKPTLNFKWDKHQLNIKVTAKCVSKFLNSVLCCDGKRSDMW